MTVVCYIDASYKSGKIGGGMFGYIYDETIEFKKIKRNNLGLIPTKTMLNGEDEQVNPEKYFYYLFRQDIDEENSNSNYAEFINLEHALNQLKLISEEYNITNIYLYGDHDLSMECMIGKHTGGIFEEKANQLRELKNTLPNINFEIVKGHSEILGNEIVDMISSVLLKPLEGQVNKLHYLNIDFKELDIDIHPWNKEKGYGCTFYKTNTKSIYKISPRGIVVKDTVSDRIYSRLTDLINSNNITCSEQWLIKHNLLNQPIMRLYYKIFGENIIITKPYGEYGENNKGVNHIMVFNKIIAHALREKKTKEIIKEMEDIEYWLTNQSKNLLIKPVTNLFWEKVYKVDKISRIQILPKNCRYMNIVFDDFGGVNFHMHNYNNEFTMTLTSKYFENAEIYAWIKPEGTKVYKKGFLITDGHGNSRIIYDNSTYIRI